MKVEEIKFDVVSKLSYNSNLKDSEQLYYDGNELYQALVLNNQLRASGPLTNGHLPLNEDKDLRYYSAPSNSPCESVHNEIKNILRK